MNLYNLFYQSEEKRIEKRNITKEEVQEFIDSLGVESTSNLRVTQVKNREEDEER